MEKAFLMDSSKRAEGVPAFGLPLFSLGFLTNLFLFQIYWIKPCTFREVGMDSLRRFSSVSRLSWFTSLPALGPVSLHFLRFARLFTNAGILERGAPVSFGSEIQWVR